MRAVVGILVAVATAAVIAASARADFYGATVAGGSLSGASSFAPQDWTPDMSAVWLFEEAAGSNAIDATGNGNTMTDNGSVPRATGVQGDYAADVLSGTDYFTCTEANCPDLDAIADAEFTFGCWVNPTNLHSSTPGPNMLARWGTTTGWRLGLSSPTNRWPRCGAATTATEAFALAQVTTNADEWMHLVCRFQDTGPASQFHISRNGVNTDGGVISTSTYAPTDVDAIMPETVTSQQYDGLLDECFFDDVEWTNAQAARACSIQIDGSLGRCDAANPTNYLPCNSNADCGGVAICDTGAGAIDDTYCVEGTKSGCCMGRNSTACSGAALTACNAAAPGPPWVGSFAYRRVLESTGTHDAYSSSTDYIEVTDINTTAGYQADCDDLQVYYWNGVTNAQVKRKVTGCGTVNTKVYFKVPYDLAADANLRQGGDQLYLYSKDAGATCGAGCSDYVNTNFPQAPLTPSTQTVMLYDFETTTGCNVCTGDAAYNDRGCTTNGDCGTGTCTATVDLCDMSGIQTPHHLDGCNIAGTDCSSQPTPVFAASARIGDKAISCYDGGPSYRAIEPNFDDSSMAVVTVDLWFYNEHTENSNGAHYLFGTDSGLRLRYMDTDEATAGVCDPIYNDRTDCSDNNDCCWSSKAWLCGGAVTNQCDFVDAFAFDMISTTGGQTMSNAYPWPQDEWHHIRIVVDDVGNANRWRAWIDGQALDFYGNTGWVVFSGDCTGFGTPYPCCTGSGTGCSNIAPISNTTSNFLVCNRAGSTGDWWGSQDELRVATEDLGAPDWVATPITVTIGNTESP